MSEREAPCALRLARVDERLRQLGEHGRRARGPRARSPPQPSRPRFPGIPKQSFGGGTHFCLGAHLARMEAQEAIGALVRRTTSLELAVREDELAYGASLFRVVAALPVALA